MRAAGPAVSGRVGGPGGLRLCDPGREAQRGEPSSSAVAAVFPGACSLTPVAAPLTAPRPPSPPPRCRSRSRSPAGPGAGAEPGPPPLPPPGAAAGSGAGSAPAAPPQPHGAAPLPALKASPTRPQRQPAERRKVSGPGPVSGAAGHGGGSGAQSGGLEVPCHGRQRGGRAAAPAAAPVQPPANNAGDDRGRPRPRRDRPSPPGRVGSGRCGGSGASPQPRRRCRRR
ncbi:uncharacterized protein LOC115903946 [Camarhynchus parvulus]|uniref:uncharacterized protein LOC115903946 n=1 Tax=Geospiza parvula TaxID=87175 RepID=UPI001237C1A6|nr:uncharacterized protein LOC115903946 [Camarhynchus parvulus]